MTGQKPPPKKLPKNSSFPRKKKGGPKTDEVCPGVTCLGGQPAQNCRKSSPSTVLSLMRIEVDCCPLWTCTFGGNGSMYYYHSGMWQKSMFWKSGSGGEDVSEMITESPVVPTTTTTTIAPRSKKGISWNLK